MAVTKEETPEDVDVLAENESEVDESGNSNKSDEGSDESEESEEDAEIDKMEEEEDENDGEAVNGDAETLEAREQTEDVSDSNDENSSSESDAAETEADSDEEEESTAQVGAEDEDEEEESEDEMATTAEQDPCLFCEQVRFSADESEDEADLTCKVCRKPAHRACAREKEALKDNSDVSLWRCPACAAKTTSESPKGMANKPRHSASRLVRDLLPVSRGVQKPGAHSIFAQPLIQDEDGGRALRKRRSPTSEAAPRSDRKRRKTDDGHNGTSIEHALAEGDRSGGHSTRRSSQKLIPIARILQYRPFHKPPPHKFILSFRLDQARIEEILSRPPRPTRRRDRKRHQKIPPPPVYQPPVPKFPALPTHNLIFPSMFGDRENEINAKPYGGILTEPEADTSRSYPQMRDREIFETARKEAEEERRKTSAAAELEINGDIINGNKPSRTVSGPPTKIKCIQFGKYVIDTSYAAPYPEEYSHESRLFICEFCLKYLPSEFVAYRHKLKCPAKHPPGDEIYRDGSVSIWEVDGRKKTEYCQCLCLMAKLFLGSKTLYYDVDPFLFYILTEYDELGYHFVGYFSKEKRPASQNNVSCILVMPIHQRKGYATFLIDFSYLLTRIEGKEGSPEKPLSDMGLTAYRSYWDLTISKELMDLGDKHFSVKEIMTRTGMTADDVVHSLERLYAFIKDPVTKTYAIRFDKKLYESIVFKYEAKDFRKIRADRLVWTPYVMGRSDAATLDNQPMHTVAQREETVEATDDEVAVETKDMELDAPSEDVEDIDHVSPKTSKVPSRQSPDEDEPRLADETGNVAPGPPSTITLTAAATTPVKTNEPEIVLVNGHAEKVDVQFDDSLTGYALAYRVEKIPATRFQIDPPIPSSMLRNRSVKKKGQTGTPKINGGGTESPALIPVRSSPRKAGSLNGSTSGQISRATSPDKPTTPMRRSVRRSGLATELVPEGISADEDAPEVEEEEDVAVKSDGDEEESEDGSAESEEGSEEDEASAGGESDDSSDPDAEIEEEEEDESDAASESDVDIPSAPSIVGEDADDSDSDTDE